MKKLISIILLICMIFNTTALAIPVIDTAESAEEIVKTDAYLAEDTIVPGVNAFTGTTAIKNFTAADIALVTVNGGYAERWNGGDRLRLRPNTPGANFTAKIALPLEIDRPALTLSDVWLMSGQCSLNGTVYTGPWENQKFFTNAHVDTGADKAYGKDYVSLAMADQGGTNIYIFWQMAVVPYYQITYKNVLPDGSTGEDVVKYYLGTEAEKAAITNAATGITGLPTNYAVEDVALIADGYTLVGWSLTEGGEAVDAVALANEDIVLYPVWVEGDVEVPNPDEDEEEKKVVPGVNAFTGTTAVKLFTAEDLTSIVTTEGSSAIWPPNATGNRLRLYPPKAGANFTSKIQLPVYIDRPAFIITDLHLMSTQLMVNSGFFSGAWEKDNIINDAKIDTGADKAYDKDNIGITIADLSGTNVNVIYNLAVIPYYQITYKNILPDGTSAEDKVVYYLGTEEEKAAMTADDKGVLGIPSSFTPSETLSHEGAEFLGWSTVEGAAIAEKTVALENKDIVLYPVWSNAVANDCIATIYLDEAKTAKRLVSAKEGEVVKLPSYESLEAYTPEGKMPEGFMINGKLYSPGDSYIFKANDINIEITSVYKSLVNPEYGELIFLETFESVSEKTLYDSDTSTNVRHKVSYINKAYSGIGDYFTIGKADGSDDILITDDGTGNMAVCVASDSGFKWPQFSIRKSNGGFYSITAKGEYTLVADVMVPASSMDKISSINATAYKNGDTNYYLSSSHKVAGSVGDIYYPVKIAIEINNQAYTSLNQHSFFASCPGDTGLKFYVDNIALYVQKATYDITGLGANGDITLSEIFIPGKTLKVPTQADMLQYAKPGYVVSGFVMGDKAYNLGDEIPTTVNDTHIALEAVYEKKTYRVHASLGSGNGTLSEMTVSDGDSFKTPDISGITSWRIPGTDITLPVGETVTFDMSDVKFAGNLYADTLFVEAVYQDKIEINGFECKLELQDGMFEGASADELVLIKAAYGAGIVSTSNEFDGNKTITLGEVVEYAAKLYNEYYGNDVSYANTQAAYEAMLAAGVTTEIANLNAEATVSDAVKIFANAVADSEFKLLSSENHETAEAQKLIRAGIIAKDENLDTNLSFSLVVDMIGKIVDPKLRSASGVKVYIFGDSLCAGTGAPSHTGWIRKYANYWDSDIAFVNYAVGGISSVHAFKQEGYRPAMDALKPGDYLFIALGTNDSTLWQDYQNVYNQPLTYEQSLAAYLRLATEAASAGATPIFICPAGRNTVKDGVYYDGDPDIINCMKDAAEASGIDVSIINFKDITHERFGAMTADERAEIYYDGVHYTDYGANVVCGIFEELLIASDDYRLGVLKNALLSEKAGMNSDDDEGDEEPEVPEEPEESVVVPGVNAFTGTTAAKLFTAEDLTSIVTTEGSAAIWPPNATGNRLRLYPPKAGANFVSSIKLPVTIDRPAFIITDLHLMSTQLKVNQSLFSGAWEVEKIVNDAKIDTGADTAYGKDTVDITIADMSGTNVNVIYNLAVIPYYQITYKNILPDGLMGEDIVKYYMGTAAEKAAMTADATKVSGIPESYAVENVALTSDGYTLLGWSTEENATEASQSIALANEDIVLYPVWVEGDVEVPGPGEGEDEEEKELIPGVNAFTGTTAVQNFTTEDLSKIVTTEGRAVIWPPNATGNRLRLYPLNAGASFASSIKLPVTIDRPALTITDLHVMSTQIAIDGQLVVGASAAHGVEKYFTSTKVDTGAETAYGKNCIDISIADLGMENVNIFYNMAVIPYYRITFKNIRPDGSTGEDIVKYYLGTEEDKAAIRTSKDGVTGIPDSYVPDEVMFAPGYKTAGWNTEEGSDEALHEINLENSDIILYPVWEEYIDFTLSISGEEQTYIGETYTFSHSFSTEIPNTEIVWSVDNEEIAEIDQNGIFTPKKAGNVNVICTPKYNTNKECKLNITVKYYDFTAEIVGKDYISKEYRSEYYKCNIISGDIPVTDFVWSVDNKQLASIDSESGKLVPYDNGVVTVIATSVYNPEYSVSLRVELTNQQGPHTLTYMPGVDDGSVSGLPESQIGVGTVKLSKVRPVREGYVFIGWSPKKGKIDTVESISLTYDKEVYAVWAKGFSFEFNGTTEPIRRADSCTIEASEDYLIVKTDAVGDARFHFDDFNIDPDEYHYVELRLATDKRNEIDIFYKSQMEKDGEILTFGYNENGFKDAAKYAAQGFPHFNEGLDNWFVCRPDMFSGTPNVEGSWFLGRADIIKNIYIDVTNAPNSTVYVDYIRFISEYPEEQDYPEETISSNKGNNSPKVYDTTVENLTKPGTLGGTDGKANIEVIPLNFKGVTDEILLNFNGEEDLGLFSGMNRAELSSVQNSEFTVKATGSESSATAFETHDISLDADSHRYVIIKAKSVDLTADYLRMYFVGDDENTVYSNERSKVVKIDDDYSMLIYDMSEFDKWKGTVSRLLFSFIGKAEGVFKIDWIMFTNSIPEDMDAIKGVEETFPYVIKESIAFEDVNESDWFCSDVTRAYKLGLVKGVSDKLYNPNGNVTIAEAITVAVRLNRIYNGEEPISSTADAETWYTPYVLDAVEKGIIKENQFTDYNKPALRKEVAHIIYNALPAAWYNAINVFEDIPDFEQKDKAFGPVIKLYRAGVVIGSDAKYNFMPDTNITRAELAAILGRCALPEMRKRVVTEAELEKLKMVFNAEDLIGRFPLEGLSPFVLKNGLACTKSSINDPIMHIYRLIGQIDGKIYKRVRIGMKWDKEKVPNPVAAECKLFFTTPDGSWAGERSIVPTWNGSVNEKGVGEFIFNLSSNSQTNGIITAMRFDPFDVADVELAIEYIIVE